MNRNKLHKPFNNVASQMLTKERARKEMNLSQVSFFSLSFLYRSPKVCRKEMMRPCSGAESITKVVSFPVGSSQKIT